MHYDGILEKLAAMGVTAGVAGAAGTKPPKPATNGGAASWGSAAEKVKKFAPGGSPKSLSGVSGAAPIKM